jgi:hypothetical protein
MCYLLKEAVIKSAHPQHVMTVLLTFLFKAFFVSAIVNPEHYLPSTVQLNITPDNRRALFLIAKGMSLLSHATSFILEEILCSFSFSSSSSSSSLSLSLSHTHTHTHTHTLSLSILTITPTLYYISL